MLLLLIAAFCYKLLLDTTRDDAVLSVDTLEVLAALASERPYHQDFLGVLAIDVEGTRSGELAVSSDKFVYIIYWIFHFLTFVSLIALVMRWSLL